MERRICRSCTMTTFDFQRKRSIWPAQLNALNLLVLSDSVYFIIWMQRKAFRYAWNFNFHFLTMPFRFSLVVTFLYFHMFCYVSLRALPEVIETSLFSYVESLCRWICMFLEIWQNSYFTLNNIFHASRCWFNESSHSWFFMACHRFVNCTHTTLIPIFQTFFGTFIYIRSFQNKRSRFSGK